MPKTIHDPNYKNQTKIYWNPNYQLKISDFKGTTADSNAAAFSHVSFEINEKIHSDEKQKRFSVESISLRAFFVPERSFYNHKLAKQLEITKEQEDAMVLHEQGHFDLEEEFLPSIKKKFQSQFKGRSFYTLDDLYTKVNEFFSKIYDEHMKIQINYDKKTNHGRIRKIQEVYNNRFKNFRKNYDRT